MTPDQQQHPAPVAVTPDALVAGYAEALAGETQRRIIAEAAVATLQNDLAKAKADLHAMSPGAPEEGRP